MNRSPATSSVRAFVALLVTLLQVIGALHCALVPHGFSASLGGIVHLHSGAAAKPAAAPQAQQEQAPALEAGTASCLSDRCPVADAPQPTLLRIALLPAGHVDFGIVRLLSERTAQVAVSRCPLLSAPKTSPPA